MGQRGAVWGLGRWSFRARAQGFTNLLRIGAAWDLVDQP